MRIAYLAIILFLSSCGVFEPRDPEEPTSGNSSYIPPTTYSLVVQNIMQAISEKNVDNYIACFVSDPSMPDFIFSPSAEIMASSADIFSNWDISDEKRYFTTEIASLENGITPSLSFEELNYESLSPDSISFTSNYSLKIPQNTNDEAHDYRGKLQYIIIKNKLNGLWFVYTWKDISIEEYESWSSLKAQS